MVKRGGSPQHECTVAAMAGEILCWREWLGVIVYKLGCSIKIMLKSLKWKYKRTYKIDLKLSNTPRNGCT